MTSNMRILVGYDGSNSGDAALYDLRGAGLPANGEVVVLTSAEVSPHLPPSIYEPMDAAALAKAPSILRNAHTIAQPALEEARSTAARGADVVRAELPEWKVFAEAATDYCLPRAGSKGRPVAARPRRGRGQ